jgi:hypothetical protein
MATTSKILVLSTPGAVDPAGGLANSQYQTTTTFTQAQILAMNTVPLVVVPAAGAGTVITPLSITLFLRNPGPSTPFAAGSNIQSGFVGGSAITIANTQSVINSGSVAATTTVAPILGDPTIDVRNVGFWILSTVAFTGGNASSTLTVTVTYRVTTF